MTNHIANTLNTVYSYVVQSSLGRPVIVEVGRAWIRPHPPDNSVPLGFEMLARTLESLIAALDWSAISQSIRDCYRLGKYRPLHERPHPILVQLKKTSDVSEILIKRGSVHKTTVVKPDLSPEQRKCKSTLMCER